MSEILLGLSTVFQPFNLLLCIGGLFAGIIFGALPGFSATMAVAVFIPFSYVLEPASASYYYQDCIAEGYMEDQYRQFYLEFRELLHLLRQQWKEEH